MTTSKATIGLLALVTVCQSFADIIVSSVTWERTFVSLPLQSGTQSMTLKSWSHTHCVSVAMNFDWAVLACYYGATCLLSDAGKVPNTKSSEDQVTCHTRFDPTNSCFVDGEYIADGETWKDACDIEMICEGGNYRTKIVMTSQCPDEFTKHPSLGCYLAFSYSASDWCTARKTCLSWSTDLFPIEDNTNMEFIGDHTKSAKYWVGNWNTNATHFRATSGVFLNKNTKDWFNGPVNNPDYCVGGWQNRLTTPLCTENIDPLCKVMN